MPRTSADSLYLTPLQLIEFTRFWADEVAHGKYPYIDYDPDERWHQRIYRDRRVDVWLISWLPTQGTQLHDHGGSAGSFTVLDGELTEAVVTGGDRLVDHRRGANESVGFGARYVHDVRNLSDAPAVSVHAYSAPLTSMNFYDLNDGRLERLATLATDDPEPEVDLGSVRRAS
ncbi:Cysteine dioxygenase type I [Jatrophihabitans endophyticus]|uniref:Cysteine dioxygenase type I n=1 Tax=Jatrophihabitans endophyticus TaxID=1206085 RepID=A0A1M5PBF0_9ACTN|nr:cysteine dioxygenase family protein [Jatrophihabitans endophyticus]SHG98779.1 Cysteine dioxygenase type I [Jatrophihabitans endophyticus]